jgi:hypothetical protein
MRLLEFGVALVSSSVLFACAGDPPQAPDIPPSQLLSGDLPPGGSGGPPAPAPASTNTKTPAPTTTGPPVASAPGVDPATTAYPEVVYLIMAGKDGWTWFCTASLVSKDTAVTAAHCLQSDLFLSWQVVAPTIAGVPRIKVTKVAMYDDAWSDVAHPDLGAVKLETGIDLPQYAVLTDVVSRVEGGEALSVQTIVRTAEQPEAPFHKTGSMPLSSAVKYGYDHGFAVPMYSHGGDSGAGLFLVENGAMSHKLVGIEREPDPQRKLDHLSRIEAAFATWVGQQ